MKIFTCKTFTGHYPVGVAAVVAANDAETAAAVLNDHLKQDFMLPGDAKASDMVEFQIPSWTNQTAVRVINDGNY